MKKQTATSIGQNMKRKEQFIYFAADSDCADGNPHRIMLKQDLQPYFRDFLFNAREYPAAVADDSWTLGLPQGTVKSTDDDDLTMADFRRAKFVVWTNPDEFHVWIGDAAALRQYAGGFYEKTSD